MTGDFPLTYHGDQIGFYWTNLCGANQTQDKSWRVTPITPAEKILSIHLQMHRSNLLFAVPIVQLNKVPRLLAPTNALSGLRQRRKLRQCQTPKWSILEWLASNRKLMNIQDSESLRSPPSGQFPSVSNTYTWEGHDSHLEDRPPVVPTLKVL